MEKGFEIIKNYKLNSSKKKKANRSKQNIKKVETCSSLRCAMRNEVRERERPE